MALAKDQTTSCSFYGNILEPGSSIQFPYMTPYEFDEYIQKEDGDGMESLSNNKMTSNQVMNYSPSLSNSSSGNSSNGFATHHHGSSFQPHEEAHSLITLKSGYENFIHSTGSSLLSFHQQGDAHRYHGWQGSSSSNSNSSNLCLLDEASKSYQDAANEWLYDEATLVDPSQECGTQQTCFNKRPQMEENMQSLKKQCIISPSKKPAKPKSSTSKDPQSIAAKNRRERISERLKILQDLVPNGSKVDLVTMLEKAISYVKFLQLQVKVLATDEFWPEAGGKAPDISQVKEAIDAILSSQRLERAKPSSNS